jgi:hypothetical protein
MMCFEQEKKENFTLWTPEKWQAEVFQIFENEYFETCKLETVAARTHQKKNTRWGRSIKTEERMALNCRLFYKNVKFCITCCPHRHRNRLKTSQKAIAFWLTIFVNVRVAVGRSRTWTSRPQSVERRPILIHTCHAVPTTSAREDQTLY